MKKLKPEIEIYWGEKSNVLMAVEIRKDYKPPKSEMLEDGFWIGTGTLQVSRKILVDFLGWQKIGEL